ncbi:hypothetical protein ERO13_A04G138600v2 [Gossypium hirsutum]|uniref:TLC domain-containing protein At5g14285 n=1 Tax=Gossypium hirsutum TaxID=3635 RepID=A0A1U8M2I6_GOSHI|nr:TLC domain-containing protein At5g14285 [Gossypium hirsutum]KAG4206028.1 hypothetical protein ERO13_A04G138600v2 [Gossypium hirsutum]
MGIPSFQTLTLPTFIFFFVSSYLLAYFRIFHNWDPKHRAEASSCFISLTHGTTAVFMAIHALTTHTTKSPSPPTFSSPNTFLHNTVLEFSISYFSIDLLHYLIFFPNDTLFILHHLATLYVFFTCRFIVQHGSFALLVLLILAEITSFCQNVWTLAGYRKADLPVAGKVFDLISLPFFAFYTIVRGIIGPLFVYKMGVFYINQMAGDSIPVWAWVSWMIVIVTAILISIVWVFDHWIDWFKRRKARNKLA